MLRSGKSSYQIICACLNTSFLLSKATTIAPVSIQGPLAQDQLVEVGSTEVPPEPEASLAEYNVSAGDLVQDTTIQPTAPDIPSTAVPTDEPQDYQQPEPPTASGHNDEEARTEDPVSAPSTSPQLPPASSRPIRYRRPPDRLNLWLRREHCARTYYVLVYQEL
jgi:hypothetical protein